MGAFVKTVKLPSLAFEISREIGSSIRGQKLLIACSGGVDSVALVDVLAKLAPRLELELAVAHIHHGPGFSERDRARDFVRDLARTRGLEFFVRESANELRSEEALREFRLASLKEMARGFDRVVLGHHADDLLETRLMRLIRGTGPQGLMAMRKLSKQAVRPFLSRTHAEIIDYAKAQKLDWVEDSSNEDTKFLRNWIRHDWLPMLEAKRPGSKAALTRSLDLLSAVAPRVAKASPKFGRREFERMSSSAKKEWVLGVANGQGVRDFSQSKIIEVLKRLDRLEVSRQHRDSFVVGGVEWSVTPDEIVALRRLGTNAGPRS